MLAPYIGYASSSHQNRPNKPRQRNLPLRLPRRGASHSGGPGLSALWILQRGYNLDSGPANEIGKHAVRRVATEQELRRIRSVDGRRPTHKIPGEANLIGQGFALISLRDMEVRSQNGHFDVGHASACRRAEARHLRAALASIGQTEACPTKSAFRNESTGQNDEHVRERQ